MIKDKVKKLLLPAILLLAVYYAVFGGEYSYFELRRTRKAVAKESVDLTVLRHQIDSLKAWAESLDVDSATLERLARERFGMIRGGEVLYRFAEPDDTTDSAAADTVPHR